METESNLSMATLFVASIALNHCKLFIKKHSLSFNIRHPKNDVLLSILVGLPFGIPEKIATEKINKKE